MKIQTIQALLALSLAIPLASAQTDDAVGSLAAPWLQAPPSPRSAALAATVAAPAGAAALGDNPAGLAGLTGWSAALGHTLGIEGLAQQQGSLAWGNGRTGVGLGFDYLSFGAVDAYRLQGGQLQAAGSFNPYAMTASLGASHRLDTISLGATATWAAQSLDGASSAGTVAADAGLLWKGRSGFSLGLAGQNLGGQLEGANLPAQAKGGLAYEAKLGSHLWLLSADYTQSLAASDGSANQIAAGTEFWLHPSVALRAGYTLAQRGSLGGTAGLSGGLGIRYQALTLHYAYSGLGELGAEQVLGLELGWGGVKAQPVSEAKPKPKAVAPAGQKRPKQPKR